MSEDSRRAPLPPGSTIGILGSGQLGRMLAMAAARLGLRTHVYCADSGPAFDVATRTTKAAFDDTAALSVFAATVDAVTFEFENVAVDTARHLAGRVAVRPSAKALEVAQDRLTEKEFIAGLGIPVAPFRAVDGPAELAAALASLAGPAILKSRRLGYDGKGQAPVSPGEDAAAAWAKMGGKPAVLEKRIPFTLELSTLVVRGQDGASAFYDCPRNTHEGGILRRSVVPSGLPPADLTRARDIAGTIAGALDYIGVLAVEMFYLGADAPEGERLMVNEIAPRVHNSGHWTIEACPISQFENHIRAVAGWPLGSTARHSDAEMVNLIGREALDWQRLAAEPGASLHLYGKREARAGRKMGHVTRLLPAIPRS
jgi:5-(carboxyamino)imidazole ribonucleotide synthase